MPIINTHTHTHLALAGVLALLGVLDLLLADDLVDLIQDVSQSIQVLHPQLRRRCSLSAGIGGNTPKKDETITKHFTNLYVRKI